LGVTGARWNRPRKGRVVAVVTQRIHALKRYFNVCDFIQLRAISKNV
jgi:hypothetical protein